MLLNGNALIDELCFNSFSKGFFLKFEFKIHYNNLNKMLKEVDMYLV